MSLSGPDALKSMTDALRDIRREEDTIVRRLGRSTELLTKIRTQEAELYRQLLATRLDAQGRGALLDQIGKAEAEATDALRWHESDLDVATAEIGKFDAALAEADANRAALQLKAAARDQDLRTLVAKARPRLGKDSAYLEKVGAARALSEQAEASLKKTAEAEASRERNGRPYRDDPLFSYLWARDFGTEKYRRNSVTTWLDGQVAKLIGYQRARENFALLVDIPVRLRTHSEQLRRKAEAAALDIARLESSAVDSAGGKAPREEIEAIVEEIAALDRGTAMLEDARDDAIRAHRKLAQEGSAAFGEALGTLTGLLRGTALRQVGADARSAPKGQDTTIVAQLDDLARRALEEQDQAHEDRARLRTLEMRRRDLEDLLYEIRLQGFDNPHSLFMDDELSGEALNVFLHGEISLDGYWERWRASHRWSEPHYGGPGGGWGKLPAPEGDGIGRRRREKLPDESLTSAA